MAQITTARLQQIDRRWRATVNKYRGPIPAGLAVAHIITSSNGVATPPIRDTKRSVGLMQVPFRVGLKYGYKETELEKPVVNIYVWCAQTNEDSAQLHRAYASVWTQANYDFWLSVHLIYRLGFVTYQNLVTRSAGTTPVNQLTSTLQQWVRTQMPKDQRFGTFGARDLRRIVDELDLFRNAMTLLDGPNKVSEQFYRAPEKNPGGAFETLRALHS